MRRLLPLLVLPAIACCVALPGCSRAAKVRTFAMGERVEVGRLIYTVYETQWLTQIGVAPEAKVPQHRFFLVRVSIVNSGNSDTLAPAMTIVDDSGATYAELTSGDGVPQWIGYLRQIKPAEAAQGNVVFDAPPRRYKLRLTDENEEKTALVDIPLTFNAETPDAPVPSTDKGTEKK